MATPTLVARDVLAALDAAGVRCEVIDTDAGYTVLRFDHVALDRLAEVMASDPNWDDCPNCEGSVLELAELQHTVRRFIAEVRAS